jgi:hypothetical protein
VFVTGCLGYLESPRQGKNDPPVDPVYFSIGAVRHSVADAKELDTGDASLMSAGLRGLGLTQWDFSTRLGVGQMLEYLESPSVMTPSMELVYLTGHGSHNGPVFNDVVLTPWGAATLHANGSVDLFLRDNPLEIRARYVVLANCVAGNANWHETFTERTEAVFAYTVNTRDSMDNDVAVAYLECLEHSGLEGELWTTEEHHACWVEANKTQAGIACDDEAERKDGVKCGDRFATGWVSFLRRNDTEVWRVEAGGKEELVRSNVPTVRVDSYDGQE